MDITEVRARVAGIRDHAGDDERAHSDEDELHQEVLAAIAEGMEDPAELAAEALRTRDVEFARWCA